MVCRFEYDGDCGNCGSPQYMARCRPLLCGCAVPITNADCIRALAALCGFEILNWVRIRVIRTGNEY